MDFIKEDINKYAEEYTESESDVLKELDRETHVGVLHSRMLSGKMQGRFLSMISKMIQPERILEIGTYTGYSAICLCEGLKENGTLFTIDVNDELNDMIHRYINKANLQNKITLITGDAKNELPLLNHTFDLVFIDADKKNYALYYDLIFEKVKVGGYILADNVLWSGHVLEDENEMDEETKAIHDFNQKIKSDTRVSKILLPIRDGLFLIRRNK
jgi:predicted O-methyltransferase YrrM